MKKFVVKLFPEERENLMLHIEDIINESCEKVVEEHKNDWCAWCAYLNKVTELYELYQRLMDAVQEEDGKND